MRTECRLHPAVRGYHTGALPARLREVSLVFGYLLIRPRVDLVGGVFDRRHRLLR